MAESHDEKFVNVFYAIMDLKGEKVGTKEYNNDYLQLQNCIAYLNGDSLSTEEAERLMYLMKEEARIKLKKDELNCLLYACQDHILDTNNVKMFFDITDDDFIFDSSYVIKLSRVCEEGSLDADCVKMFLKRIESSNCFYSDSFSDFLNACGENSLDEEDLEKIYHSCSEYLFERFYKEEINSKLNKVSQKFFQSLCEFHEREREARQREEKARERLEKLVENDKQGIFGGIGGVIFGGFIGLGAIGFVVSWAIGLIALSVTTVAAITAPIVAVSLVLLCFFSYWIDKCIENKTLIEIQEGKREKIRKDLLHRKKIKDALNNSKEPLLQNGQEQQL